MQAHLINFKTMATSRNKAGHQGGAARVVDGDNRGEDAGWKHNSWLSSLLAIQAILGHSSGHPGYTMRQTQGI